MAKEVKVMHFKIFVGNSDIEEKVNSFVERVNVVDIDFCVDNGKVYVLVKYTVGDENG